MKYYLAFTQRLVFFLTPHTLLTLYKKVKSVGVKIVTLLFELTL